QQSNDYFKFGTCKWGVDEFGSTTCVKDADGNEKADCSVYDTVCQSDNTPPETMIVPDAAADNGGLILGRDVYIKLETSEPAITYFCFAKEGQTCYPAESTACGIQKRVDYNGAYTMFYYSEDRAHNIEEVKSIDVAFDSKIPAITAGKQIYNKRTEIITLTTDSEVTCSARLEDDLGVPAYPDVVIDKVQLRAGSSISRTYTNLPDDNYHFVYECSNRAGNKADGVVSFSIDNNRIHDPKPVNPVTKTAVDMSVGTDQLAECKYSPTTGTDQRYDSMQFSFIDSPDGLSHTTTQYVLLETPYSFDVKCRFADGIEGENNDRIRFAVDSKPPAVEAVSTFAAYGFDQSQTYGSKQTLMIQCSDNWFLKNRNVKGMDLGCDRTTYTYTDPSTGNDVTKELSGEGLSDPFTVDSTQLIRFTTNDLGGNTETNAINVQINVLPTILDIDVFKAPMTGSSEPLKAVAYGDYIIKLSSSKNLVAAIADVRVEGDQIYNIPVRFFRSEDFGKTQLFTFTIPWSLPGMLDKILGINVTAVVAMPGEFCSVEAAAEENKYYYAEKLVFDTTVPEADLAPALDKYNSKPYFYPLNEEGGIYYTNQNLLFVTGKAKAGTAKVNYYVGQRLTDIKLQQRYDLAQNANPKETGSLTNFQGNIGETFVYNFLAGISGFGVMPGNYLEFKDPRTSYGHYKEYYRIIDIDGQQVELEYPLEKDVNLKDTAKVFNAAHPSDWFGANIGLERGTNYFFIRPESSGGQEGYLDKIYTIVYDPQPPEVIKQVPQKGFSENKNTIISIIVRKPIGSSQLDTSNVKLYLNGKTAKLEKITNISDGQYYYYNITHIPATLDGTYIVNFTGFDYALNPLTATSSASPKWIFTVNKDSPMAPVFDVRDGVYYNGVWFTKKSPEFSLFFQDAIDVEITAYYNNFVGNYINVPACKETADANYFTGCRFDPELVPNVVGPGGSFVENEYQIIVEARKLFEDGAEGPRSPLFLDKLVIDDVAPDIGSVVYPDKIRGDYDIVFDAVVNNEVHDLNATLLFKNRYYILTQVGRAGRHYYFKWTTPALDFSDPAIKREYEGDTTLSLKIADYAGNYDTADLQTYMDLSLPNVKDLHVSVMPTRILDTGLVTNQTEIRVRGNFTDDDVRSVYIIPGDYVFVPGKRPILEDISELANIVGNTFELTMLINGTFNTTTLNKLNVYMEDDAGNAAFTPLYVVADLQPPYVVSTAIS
ncbi:MAG TPA: hypothetical protein VJC00_00595, partial [Candidatus Nanoarchaeia archaeon]|nr:hypothetical protein [Candidatus Nanoarchaeia archaeon]